MAINQPQVSALLKSQSLAVLATVDAAGPYQSLVKVMLNPDLNQAFFVTSRATRKYRNLSARPQVSLLWDDRAGLALCAQGQAREIDDQRRREAFIERHPDLAAFARRPDCALIAVRLERFQVSGGVESSFTLRLDQV